jgi:hypothetical protein
VLSERERDYATIETTGYMGVFEELSLRFTLKTS